METAGARRRKAPQVGSVAVPPVEHVRAPFDAQPNWGKAHGTDVDLSRVVPRLADARALLDGLDPEGVYRSARLT